MFLQRSFLAYMVVNATHILGIGLLIGAILPLDLRLAGLFRQVPLPVIGPFLARSAAVGVGLAILTGLWLFTVRPADYLANPAFLWKLGLLALALGNVALQHCSEDYRHALAGGVPSGQVRLLAGISALLWIAVLLAGRWIGFL